MKIATWNVNSVRSRHTHVCRWLERYQPDLLLLQEIKCEAHQFPDVFAALGYHAEFVGQKSYNGVAVLARTPPSVTCRALPGLPEDDAQARYIEVAFAGMRVGNLYLPNGNSGGDAGYAYKLRWMDCLADRAESLLEDDTPLALLGDYNVCPTDDDYYPGTLPPSDALLRPETRSRFRRLLWHGLTDAVRALRPSGAIWTFWDYQAGAWQRDRGLRIDHALLSPHIAERLVSVAIHKDVRGEDQPSDHVPLMIELGE